MLLLKSGQIDVWFTFVEDIQDEQLLAQYQALLSQEERQQKAQFYFAKDQHRYLITRALVRVVLSKYVPITPSQWTFSTNPYGKPQISNVDAMAQCLSFNISHTDGLVIVAVCLDNAIGVDTENIKTIKVPTEDLESFLAPEEIQTLPQISSIHYPSAFFAHWTLKEAYIKARGEGLTLPVQEIIFRLEDKPHIHANFRLSCKDDPAHWHFWLFAVRSDYLMAICLQRQLNIIPKIYLKTIIPLQSEVDMKGVLLCQS